VEFNSGLLSNIRLVQSLLLMTNVLAYLTELSLLKFTNKLECFYFIFTHYCSSPTVEL
jgi:hypothetical protein